MYRLILSIDGLARVRISEGDLLATETVFALESLNHADDDVLREWRRRTRRTMAHRSPRMRHMAETVWSTDAFSKLLHLCTGTERPPATLHGGVGTSSVQLPAAVREFSDLAVAPHWERVRAHLDSARDTLRETMCAGGVGALLNGLGPGIRWQPPVLEIDDADDGELTLDGRGLVLLPSLFLRRPGRVVPVDHAFPDRPPLLVLPSRPRPGDLPGLLADTGAVRGERREDTDRLAALMGRTRAAALRAVEESCSNTELAQRLGVTTAAVSQHTAVLRGAGLISTRRSGGHAVHTVTHLGQLLLRGTGLDLRPILSALRTAGRQPASV